jgi:hypothetical protein
MTPLNTIGKLTGGHTGRSELQNLFSGNLSMPGVR